MKNFILPILLILLGLQGISAQVHLGNQVQIGLDNSVISDDIALSIDSDSLTLILPNLDAADISAISTPDEGMMIYNLDTKKYQGYTIERSTLATVSCCTNNLVVVGPFNEEYGIVLKTPTAGKIESIVLRYFFNNAYNQPVRLVISDSPKNNCDINNPTNILSLTDYFPATSGDNHYVPVNDIYLTAGQSIYIWPEQIDENIVSLRYLSGVHPDPNMSVYNFSPCNQFSFDVHAKLNMKVITNQAWVDLH